LTDQADEAFEVPGGSASATTAPAASAALAAPAASAALEAPAASVASESGIVPAAPAARKLARELGIDLVNIAGTGPNGRITVEDVQAAQNSTKTATPVAPAKGSVAKVGEWKQLAPSRLALIDLMRKSLAEIPQIHVARQLNVTPLLAGSGYTFTQRLVVAAAAALAAHPALRTVIRGNEIQEQPVSIAIAMDTPYGLLAPVLRCADSLGLSDVAQALTGFRQRAEKNALRREELIDGPFAITNLGMYGVDTFNPFVFYGQTAVLAIGRATDAGGGGKVAWFNLAVDHRVIDGAEAARFLATLQKEITTS
jgi:pyruvate dehydrogenase E2 component (dihydrolipoamide acetyltransferase)